MKKVEEDQWQHRGYDCYLREHPKLQGKYEIYLGEKFIDRACDLRGAIKVINDHAGVYGAGKGHKPPPDHPFIRMNCSLKEFTMKSLHKFKKRIE